MASAGGASAVGAIVAAAAARQSLTSKNKTLHFSLSFSFLIASQSLIARCAGCPARFSKGVPSAVTNATDLTLRAESAASCIIATRLPAEPRRSASGTTVSAGTYVMRTSDTSIVARNGMVAHMTSTIGLRNFTLVINKLSPTGGCK